MLCPMVNTSWTGRISSRLRQIEEVGGPARHLVRWTWGTAKTAQDSLRTRSLVTTRWSPTDNRWHYRWPEARVTDEGRWADAQGWATHGFYYGMDDLLWSRYRPGPGDVVLDIGAGHGGETMYLAAMVGATGRVISVEAAPDTYVRLAELCSLNDWPQVEPLQVAIAAEPGTVSMSADQGWIAGNMFEGGDVDVPATTIDQLCHERGIDHVDWLKLNIEGAEKDALRGMEQMATRVSHLTISCHDFLGTDWGRSLEVVTTWLREHGFTVEQRNEGDMVQQLYVYAWR